MFVAISLALAEKGSKRFNAIPHIDPFSNRPSDSDLPSYSESPRVVKFMLSSSLKSNR